MDGSAGARSAMAKPRWAAGGGGGGGGGVGGRRATAAELPASPSDGNCLLDQRRR